MTAVRRLDPELAAASALIIRPDLRDVRSTRQLTSSDGLPRSSATEELSDVVKTDDLEVVGRTVRRYQPVDKRNGAGVLFLHGGAFVAGDLGSEHARCLVYAARAGVDVFSLDYRLAPEHPFPAGVQDAYAALEWMVADADELDLDPDRIVVAGVSAGGGLAAAVGLLARDRGGPAIEAQMLLYPVLDDRMVSTSMQNFDRTPVWDSRNSVEMWRHYLQGAEANELAAPARAADVSSLPRTFVLTAEFDPLRDEGLAFALRLVAAGVPVDIRHYAMTYHVFDQLVPDAAIARRSLREQVDFLGAVVGAELSSGAGWPTG